MLQLVLVLLLVAVAVVAGGLVAAIVALVRSSRLEREVRALRADFLRLQQRAGAVPSPRRTEASEAPSAPTHPATRPAPPTESVAETPPEPGSPPTRPNVAAPSPVATPPAQPTLRAPRPARTTPLSRPPTLPPPRPPSPAFDWERMLGLRAAAWLGGIAIVIAMTFFARWAFEQNLITPELRIAILVTLGIGALVLAEVSRRRGYDTTANAVSGAGIATLYIAFFAAHSLYELLSLPVTFVFMTLVTVVAGVVAVRYDAVFTAVLGLLGGFATPVLLSTGVDRPVGLFSYILLLNVGLLAVARHKGWGGLVPLTLLGTFAIELSWFGRFMGPEKILVGLAAFAVFGLLYAGLSLAGSPEESRARGSAAVGGLVPFLFGALIAGERAYRTEWPLLFGFVILLVAALVVVGSLRRRAELVIGASVAAALVLAVWALANVGDVSHHLAPAALAIVIVALIDGAHLLARRDPSGALGPVTLGLATLTGTAGLFCYAFALVAHQVAEPPWVMVLIVVAIVAFAHRRSTEPSLRIAFPAVALAVGGLVMLWHLTSTEPATLARNVALLSLFPAGLAILALLRPRDARGAPAAEQDAAAAIASFGVLATLLFAIASPPLSSPPLPFFASLLLAIVVAQLAALRRWSLLALPTLAATASIALAWQAERFDPAHGLAPLAAYVLLTVAFLAVPFGAAALRGSTPIDRSLWLTSALAGPALFYPTYRAVVEMWGRSAIGTLPLVFAAAAAIVLQRVDAAFPPSHPTTPAGRHRLAHLALFAAVALGFVALAIPLQLERQWVTVAWAIEAATVFALYGRLPHAGLKIFGGILFAAVGARLLLNPEVLRYQERAWPIFNWLLYTYGVPALCCLLGARALRRAELRLHGSPLSRGQAALASGVAFLGLLLIFALINLEIADAYSPRHVLELSLARHHERDLATSAAWGLYAITLLIVGIARRGRALRQVALGFLVLTVGKVFLYDLSHLGGLYRTLSFFGLGVALLAVSLLYQRFVVAITAERGEG